MQKRNFFNPFFSKQVSKKLEEINQKLKDNSPKKEVTLFQNFGIGAQIVLAIIAVILTIKYGQSKEQINRLDSLVTKQQAQTDTLVGVLNELRKGNEEMNGQSKILSSQLQINQKTLEKSNKSDSLFRKGHLKKLTLTFSLLQKLYQSYATKGIKSLSREKQIILVDSCISLLQTEFQNPYLLENSKLYELWKKFEYISIDTKGSLIYGIHEIPDHEDKSFIPKSYEILLTEAIELWSKNHLDFINKVFAFFFNQEKIFVMPSY